ncbi:phosphatidylserine/phosphatidylglycerophosphate/cardiolipin synthase [Piscinibacter terrae]|uniref:Phosphatidylserine/phosphatidylglycerophosphate/ cardiolipin synthase n=1 Tax=Piscinibacter terrae TaxID=2496871 RepID=A0A3N7ISP5_9BURK|nr:phosphatidylserine/phosphatidylglycerophosphate/cardiolipin synthase [Albitalea terrae]RQP21872.1 phosphatidylserine/phosphatidylglycerophosphate/cardiolipin synthase [Albitalea terrae]
MTVHAVTKVRLDDDGRVTGVEWGRVDTINNQWETGPAVADVIDVVDAIHAGDAVFALFSTAAGMVPGQRFITVAYATGWETITLDGAPVHEREIHNMARIA